MPEAPDTPVDDLRATGERIDALLDASSTHGAVARERAEELVRLVTDLYGAGLERLMQLLHETGRLDDTLLDQLAADDLVASLLLVHGLHPEDVPTRVERALEGVRPYLGSHGGDVELLDVTEQGVVRLRLLGSCDGCPSSSVTLTLAVEGAISDAAPEVSAIEVEEATADERSGAGTLIPVDSLRSRLDGPAPSDGAWHRPDELAGLDPGAVTSFTLAGQAIVACRVGADLYCFRDRCARCGQSLAGAGLARRLGGASGDVLLRCPHCRVHYALRRAGACEESPDDHLEPLPVLVDGDGPSVAVPRPVGA